MVGKKVETSNKAVPARGPAAPLAPRAPQASAVLRSDPPMDVDPGELLPTIPPGGKPPADASALSLGDADLDLEDEATVMFKRPEPPPAAGPPRRPPPPKTSAGAPPAKPVAKPPLPPPTRSAAPEKAAPKPPPLVASKAPEKPSLSAKPPEKPSLSAKAPDRPGPPPKPIAKPAPPKSPDKPFLAAPAAKVEHKSPDQPFLASPVPEPKLSDAPMFEVTLGSEKPILATPEAGEISLLAPKAPNLPLLAAPRASDLATLDLQPKGSIAIAPMPALPMLDFSRDISALAAKQSSHPSGRGAQLGGFVRSHGKWLAMVGGTLAIAAASWAVFHAAAAGSDTAAAAPSARAPIAGARTVNAATTARAAAAEPAVATQPVAPVEPAPTATAEPVAAQAAEPAPAEKPEAPAAAAPAAPAEVAMKPGAAPAEPHEAPAPTERAEHNTAAAAEPVARTTQAPRTAPAERPSSRTAPAEPTTELPPAKAEPVAPPPRPAAPSGPSVGEMDGTPDFDQSAAMAALRQAAESAKRCATTDPPAGGVRIAVTFARTGSVSATQIEGAAAGTPLGDCIAAKFQSAHVPAFRGSVMTVRKTVMF